MRNQLSQIFQNISEIEPTQELEALIFKRIELLKDRRLRTELFLSYSGLAGSFLAGFWAFSAFGNALLKSEFWNILSLAFSDVMVVTANWEEYAYSLMENFPVTNLIVLLIPIFAFLLSFDLFVYLKNKYGHRGQINFKFAQ